MRGRYFFPWVVERIVVRGHYFFLLRLSLTYLPPFPINEVRGGEAMEEWKRIEVDGEVYENYEVSNLGRVRSLNYNGIKGRVQIMKARDNGTGYLNVVLYKNKKPKRFYVHRLVALMFIENDDPTVKTDVNHKDENKSNNAVDNLEWCDRKYNIHYGTCRERAIQTLKKHKLKHKPNHKPNHNHQEIICLKTGKIFDTIKDAMEWCDKVGIKMCFSRNCEIEGYFCWTYYDEYYDEYLEKENC